MKSRSFIRIGTSVLLASANAWGGAASHETLFSAHFNYGGSADQARQAFKLVIFRSQSATGSASANPLHSLAAEIRGPGQKVATCSVASVETMDDKTVAIDLSCRSARLGALTAPATLFLSSIRDLSRPAFVRFGTWLQGYEQAKLTIDLNRTAALIQKPAGTQPVNDAPRLAHR